MNPFEMFSITCLAIGAVCGLLAFLAWVNERGAEIRMRKPITPEERAAARASRDEQAAYLKQRILTDADLRSCLCQEDEARLVYDDTIDLDPWEIAAMYSRIAKEKRARGL